jgi:protein SCO1/2
VHFLTGPEAALRTVAAAVGFPYRYDAALDQYVHPAGFVIATPDGRISRYVLGIAPSAEDLAAGLADAANRETAGPLTRLLLLCRGSGPAPGRYTLAIEAACVVLNIAGLGCLVAVFAMLRRRGRGGAG